MLHLVHCSTFTKTIQSLRRFLIPVSDQAALRSFYAFLFALSFVGLHCQNRHANGSNSKSKHSNIKWPEGTPSEKMSPIDCPESLCLFVEEGSEYCSVDPDRFEEGIIFFSKSRLQVQAGTYPLNESGAIPPIGHNLNTPRGSFALAPESTLIPVQSKGLQKKDGSWLGWPSATIENETYRDPSGGTVHVNLRMTNNPKFWLDPHYRLGDPSSFFWWHHMSRSLYLDNINLPEIFPNSPRNWPILYAPCNPPDARQEHMIFEFPDASTIDLAMSISTARGGIGRNIGRLRSARGNLGERKIDITDENALAWIGSSHGDGVITPTLAIKWQESGDVCGIIFDPFAEQQQLNSFPGANNYWAFEMRCDETRGQELELKSATFPDDFELP